MTRPACDNNTHGTEAERTFLNGLGTLTEGRAHHPNRLELLQKYQRSMKRRTEWAGINRVSIERHVVALIEKAVVTT